VGEEEVVHPLRSLHPDRAGLADRRAIDKGPAEEHVGIAACR
jgi:hypothetical protein